MKYMLELFSESGVHYISLIESHSCVPCSDTINVHVTCVYTRNFRNVLRVFITSVTNMYQHCAKRINIPVQEIQCCC